MAEVKKNMDVYDVTCPLLGLDTILNLAIETWDLDSTDMTINKKDLLNRSNYLYDILVHTRNCIQDVMQNVQPLIDELD
ncbi:MAG: hypothetical protein K6G22_07580 [Lachnospiraceae bacterium]|nr:hypothetical protein [Lachnospiraceae bacterium]